MSFPTYVDADRSAAVMRVVRLADAPDDEADLPAPPGVVVAVGEPGTLAAPHAEYWLERATFTLTEARAGRAEDPRIVMVDSVPVALAELRRRCDHWPQAAAVCDDVLRSVDPNGPVLSGMLTESLAYSTLQSGAEFARWLAGREPVVLQGSAAPVESERVGDTLLIRLNRPQRHNAFSTDMRAALLEALTVARLDPTVDEVVLSGNGPSFCSGGDLGEFGTFADPASAHLARTRYSPALSLDELTQRLGRRCRAEVHGRVLGSGLEMVAYCGWVRAHPDAELGLPELTLGLLPGAGGTVSITRRIGRWRTAFLVLSGRTLDPPTALRWGVIDEVAEINTVAEAGEPTGNAGEIRS